MGLGAPHFFHQMIPKLRLYFALVVAAAGVFLLLGVDWHALILLSVRDYAGLFLLVGLAAFSEYLAVEAGQNKRVRSSIAFLPLLAMVLIFPVAAVIVGVIAAVAPARASNWKHYLFNLAQTVLSFGLAATVFQIWETPTVTGGGIDYFLSLFVPFCAAALVFFGVNILSISSFIAVRDDQPLRGVIAEATGRGGGNLLYDLLASPVAFGIAMLYSFYYIPGLVLVVLPLLLVRYTYLSALQLDRANHDLLRVLIKAIETRDPYTSGHSLRVSILARLIAEDHRLRYSMVRRIEKAALLHDIGKIDAAYTDIISKADSLTDDEFALIKTHATKGAQLLQSLTSLEKDVIEGVRHHHENYDGSGYPDGLKGKSIPLAARVIMLCDSVDAMLSDRPYRDALSIAAVKAELRRCAGTQFDPDLVKTILESGTLERADLLVDRANARKTPRVTVA
jgi:putative nucleotidyltransferase with HDIG domain